jgi:hypothetical protein
MNDDYEVVPYSRYEGWFTVLRDGEPVWHAPSRGAADRFANDPAWREELRLANTPLHKRPGFGLR